MKYTYALIALIILASCQQKDGKNDVVEQETTSTESTQETQPKEIEETPAAPKSYDYYAGAIGLYGEDVLVEVNSEDNIITGRYWYLKHGREIQLEGTSSAKGDQWQIKETVKGVETGNMSLAVKGDEITGQWYAPGRSSDLQEVNLKKVYHSEVGKIEPEFEQYEFTKTITVFNTEENEEVDVTDELRLTRIGEYILFQYEVTGTNAHSGHVNGLAKMDDSNKAMFTGEEGCKLSLSFKGNEVTVSEEDDCFYYRGMRAYFDGILTRVK